MKKVIALGFGLLLVGVVAGAGFAFDDEDGIAKRHQKWLKQVMAPGLQRAASVIPDNEHAARPVADKVGMGNATVLVTTIPDGTLLGANGGTITFGTTVGSRSDVLATISTAKGDVTIGSIEPIGGITGIKTPVDRTVTGTLSGSGVFPAHGAETGDGTKTLSVDVQLGNKLELDAIIASKNKPAVGPTPGASFTVTGTMVKSTVTQELMGQQQ